MTNSHVAVIDGSTSKAPHQIRDDIRNGRLAMLLVSEVLGELSPADSLGDFCDAVTRRIRDAYDHYHISVDRLIHHPEERLTASAAIYSIHHEEVWLVGDCQCIVGGLCYDNPKPEEHAIALKRAAIIRQMLNHGEATIASLQTDDVARKQIVDDIIATCHDQNKTFSVIDGFPIPLERAKTIKVESGDVILATDGYPYLLPTLAASEQALSHLLSTDPLLFQTYHATKGMMAGNVSFDDRAYIRFRVSK